MGTKIDWEKQIGRRLRFRDLHVLFSVVQCGSMAKAATLLGVSQPSVSEVITGLEHTLGARLLDRSPHGVEPTMYADALLKRSRIAFDELKQGIRDIEFLSDPTVGEVRIGCPESISSSILPAIVQRSCEQYPGVLPIVDVGPTDTMIKSLITRELDLVLARGRHVLADESVTERLNIEVLFQDHLVVATGAQNRWARRRKIDLAELMNERWILSGPGTWNHNVVGDAFRARGLDMPKMSLETLSMHLRANLLASGSFISVFPYSVMRLYGERFSLKALPVDLPPRPWPVTIVTLKNRTLSPVVGRFVETARASVAALAPKWAPSSVSAVKTKARRA